jgi:cysteine desulfurase
LPVPLIVGLGKAAAIAQTEMAGEAQRLLALRARLLNGLKARIPDLVVNGNMEKRLPGNLNLSFPGAKAVDLISACPGLALSTGSACTAAEVEPSYVLKALGLGEEIAASSLRLGLGRFSTATEMDVAIETLASAVRRLKSGQGPGVTSASGGTT